MRTAATATLLIELRYIYEFAIQRTAVNRDRPLFDELAHQIAIMPQRELERLRRVGLMRESALDATHPPTQHRIGFLEKRGEFEGRIKLTDGEWLAIKRELAGTHSSAEKRILDDYMRRLQ